MSKYKKIIHHKKRVLSYKNNNLKRLLGPSRYTAIGKEGAGGGRYPRTPLFPGANFFSSKSENIKILNVRNRLEFSF